MEITSDTSEKVAERLNSQPHFPWKSNRNLLDKVTCKIQELAKTSSPNGSSLGPFHTNEALCVFPTITPLLPEHATFNISAGFSVPTGLAKEKENSTFIVVSVASNSCASDVVGTH